ncbi:MAG: tripartite tricarboxylate transporter substrate binding protein [Betaproteobacteria bacterium]|nr:tripartite tricarboxylate transporter substrate binding protein [Betaproteobacteria bacterium]
MTIIMPLYRIAACALVVLPAVSFYAAAQTAATGPAQAYPAKPVRVIVPFAPGGGSDITARRMSHKLAGQFGQQFIVDNRPGAGGLVGTRLVVESAPDGYTIMISTGSWTTSAATYKPAWDPINNIAPIAEIGYNPLVLSVHPSLPSRTTREFFALARSKPGELAYATPGVGSITHLAMELMVHMAKIRMLAVPYRSTGATMTDLLEGRTQLILGGLVPLQPHLQSGKLRPLAVTTARRWKTLPDVPAMAETLPGYQVESWFGVVAPNNTPPAVIGRLNAAVNRILREPEMKKNLESEGMAPSGGTPEEFNKRIRTDYERWVRVVKDADIQAR